MTGSDIGKRGIHLGCVAVVVTALTVGVADQQPGRSVVQAESHPVMLEAAVVGAVANSSAAPPTAVTTSPASDSPTAATVAAATDDPAAIPRTIAQIAFTAVGVALAPLWYLAFPVTLPLTASLAWNAGSNLGAAGWGNLAGLILTPIAWLSVPFIAGNAVAQALFPAPTATDAPSAATAGSAPSVTQTSPAAGGDASLAAPSPAVAVHAAATASDTGLQDAVINIVRFAAGVASVAALPLWWIASPITFPLGVALGWNLTPYDAPSLSNDGIVVFSKVFNALFAGILGPTFLVNYLLNTVLPPAAASTITASATTRSATSTITSPANTARRTRASGDFGSHRASPNPASAKSKRSVAHAAAGQGRQKAKVRIG